LNFFVDLNAVNTIGCRGFCLWKTFVQ